MVPARPLRTPFLAFARLLPGLLALAALVAPPLAHAADKWPDFKDDLRIAKPAVDPEADAEALLWQIKVQDVVNPPAYHSDVSHYRRIKIFTDRGKEIAGSLDIPYEDRVNVTDLAARTIRPDGSVVEVARNAFYKRTIVKTSGRKMKAISFAFPSVEKGCIVECRWTERRYQDLSGGLVLDLQLNIPVRSTELWVCPFVAEGLEFRMRSFNMPTPYFQDEAGGFRKAVLPSTPAAFDEPFMPPEYLVKPWVVFSYHDQTEPPPDRFWSEFVSKDADYVERRTKADASVKQKADALAAGAASDDEKLDRLADFCRREIRDINEDAVGAAGSGDAKESGSAAETLRRGAGNLSDIDFLFAALAGALGFETRIARTADRREFLFDPTFQLAWTLDEFCVAVRRGESWRYFDPAARYVPTGMIPWWEEGQQAIVIEPKKERFEPLPVSPPDSNRIEGTGHFRLLADGTLEGDATETFTGQWSATLKEYLDDLSPEKRIDELKKFLTGQYTGAVVDSVRIEHVTDVDGPLVRAYHIRIPGYATRAGTRLLVPSAFFQAGVKPLFERDERHSPIYFQFPTVRNDDVRIELPEAFEVESSPDTKPFAVPGFVRVESGVQTAMDGRSLRLTRAARTCENSEIAFPASQYPAIKAAFDRIHELDDGLISLRHSGQASGQ